jgi:hypothetical protein
VWPSCQRLKICGGNIIIAKIPSNGLLRIEIS